MALSHFSKQFYTIQFNGALPVTISILEKIGHNRYRLKAGHKELSTKSLTPLKVGYRYWGDFSYTKDGILSIGNLKEKPPVLQKELEFLKINSWDLIEQIIINKNNFFKKWILKKLDETSHISEFKMLSSMLLALNEGIVHLPLVLNERAFLIQYKNNTLNQNKIHFFFAFDTMGPIAGIASEDTINLEVLFAKSANALLANKIEKNIQVLIAQKLLPLWKGDDGLLDLKG